MPSSVRIRTPSAFIGTRKCPPGALMSHESRVVSHESCPGAWRWKSGGEAARKLRGSGGGSGRGGMHWYVTGGGYIRTIRGPDSAHGPIGPGSWEPGEESREPRAGSCEPCAVCREGERRAREPQSLAAMGARAWMTGQSRWGRHATPAEAAGARCGVRGAKGEGRESGIGGGVVVVGWLWGGGGEDGRGRSVSAGSEIQSPREGYASPAGKRGASMVCTLTLRPGPQCPRQRQAHACPACLACRHNSGVGCPTVSCVRLEGRRGKLQGCPQA
jgi:hypothetical protein